MRRILFNDFNVAIRNQLLVDLNNQVLANVIRQLSSLSQFADEILGDAQGHLVAQNSRIRSIGHRIDHLHQKVQALNPKASGMIEKID